MHQTARRFIAGLTAFAVIAPFSVIAQQAPQKPAPPLIRSQITMVPIDVRVIGRDGLPITGLTAADFTVLENGVRQEIRHFSAVTFTPEAVTAGAPPELTKAAPDGAVASNRRVFLIILGRGRHQAVSKYVESLSEFVGKQLMPQDKVAVMAWNRATDFTTDHAMIAGILERYRKQHEGIETKLREWFSGLRALYGSPDIPPHIQKLIDGVYSDVAALRPRALPPPSSGGQEGRRDAASNAAQEIARNEALKTFEGNGFLPDTRAEILAELAGMPFDEYVNKSSETMQDLMSLYRAIDYLKYLEGEKHIVFLTEAGIDMPLLPGNRDLANAAADARIALNIVQTGGMAGAAPPRIVMGANGSNIVMSPLPSTAAVFNQGFSTRDLRMVADVTGGSLAAYKRGGEAFRTLADSLGSQYMIAYSPSTPATDGKFRDIQIRVNRPGARVQYRRGYFASPRVVPLERRDFVTFTRIRSAARYDRQIDDIKVTLAAGPAPSPADAQTLNIEVTVEVSKLALPATATGGREGSLEVALYVADEKNRPIGQALSRVDLSFTDAAYQRALTSGASFVMPVTIKGAPRRVKAIVYDYAADLLGSVAADIPLPAAKR